MAAPGVPATTAAAETEETTGKRRWTVEISPYGWATGIRADVSPYRGGPIIGVDKTFPEVLKNLKFAGFLDIWANYDRFVLSADVMYVDIEEKGAIRSLPKVGPTPGLRARLNSTQFVGTLQAGYRVYDTPDATLDLTAGIRMWDLSNTATVSYGPLAVSYDKKFYWTDPVVGARAFYRVSDKISLMAQGDVGGFNAGSKITWQVLGTVNYIFTDHLSASIGYKTLWVDYDANGDVYEGRYSGPILGVTYRF